MLRTILRKTRALLESVLFHGRLFFANEYITDISEEQAESALSSFSPRPASSAVVSRTICEEKTDLSIIIPAYNAEKWIEQCLSSVLQQKTRYSFSVIVIDDGSTDSTGTLIDQFATDPHIQIIHQNNQGYSGARNTGIDQNESEYLMFVDSDDCLFPDAVENLLHKAKETNADVVEGNGYCFNETGRIGPVKRSDNDLWGGPWLKVIRAKLFGRIRFPENYLYEDTIISCLVFPSAEKIVTVPDEVYAYRIHADSITQKHDENPKRLDSFWIMRLMRENQDELGIIRDFDAYIRTLKHCIFTFRRTVLLPERIQKCIFVLTVQFIREYYSSFLYNKNHKYRELENALLQNNYGKYRVFCYYYRE